MLQTIILIFINFSIFFDAYLFPYNSQNIIFTRVLHCPTVSHQNAYILTYPHPLVKCFVKKTIREMRETFYIFKAMDENKHKRHNPPQTQETLVIKSIDIFRSTINSSPNELKLQHDACTGHLPQKS